MLSLSVNRWDFTDKLFEINNLSERRRVFTDKITFCETTIIMSSPEKSLPILNNK